MMQGKYPMYYYGACFILCLQRLASLCTTVTLNLIVCYITCKHETMGNSEYIDRPRFLNIGLL